MDDMDCTAVYTRNNIQNGAGAFFVRIGVILNVFVLTLLQLKNPVKGYKVLSRIKSRREKVHGFSRVKRYVRSQGKFFFSENIPGWPSRAFNSFILGEITRVIKEQGCCVPLHTVIFAITNRCPLRCNHCFEWKNIAAEESMSADDLEVIIQKLYELDVHHIQLSGGEPLVRIDDLINLMNSGRKGIDFWILTSGFCMTLEKALKLKKAGLVGANISLDHWDEKLHNEFRNNTRSFYWVKEAVRNCNQADILTCLSLCATKSFVSDENLIKYLELARYWGAGFIRILEPRATGRFTGMDVMLKDEHIAILEQFYLRVNSSDKYRDYPIIMYPGYHQRRVGCFGAGNRYFYIDSNGDIHACPFCQRKTGNAVTDPLVPAIAQLRNTGCHEFKMNLSD